MAPYLYITKIKIQSALAYRLDVISSIALQCLVMFSVSFFWIALYGSQQNAAGVARDSMLTYTVVSSVMDSLFTRGVEDRIVQSVRRGNIAVDLIKPVNLFGMYLAEDLGSAAAAFFQQALPVLVIAAVFIKFPMPASGLHLLLFFISFLFSYAINWLFAAIFSMWAFTAIQMGPMREVKNHLIRLLSGSIIPVWFFPGWLQSVLNILPFPYIYQLPLGIYIGKYDFRSIMAHMAVQAAWTTVLLISFLLLQRKVLSKVLIQGG